MRTVLLLLPGAFSSLGGIEMYNRQLIRAFLEAGLERGIDVRALVLNDRTEDADGRYIPSGAAAPTGFRCRKAPFIVESLRSARSARPDLIVFGHIHFARMARAVRWASPASRHWYVAYGIEAWSPQPGAIRRGLADAERVLAISDHTRRLLSRSGGVPPGRIDLLPCALDPCWEQLYAPGPHDGPSGDDTKPTLLTVARLDASERYKGVDAIIRALPAVAAKVGDVRYEVVGDGDDRPRLEALAREVGLSERVTFRGRLNPNELAAAYRRCALYVMPSSHEGFGIVFLEAALFGKASIGGRHGGTPEVIEEGVTGCLADREDVPALAATLVRLLADSRLREDMGRAAQSRLREKFTYATLKSRVAAYLDGTPQGSKKDG